MKNRHRISRAVLLFSFAMMFSLFFIPRTGIRAEAKWTNDGMIYIQNDKTGGDNARSYAIAMHKKNPWGKRATIRKIKGATYDGKKNTLTLKNFNQPEWELNCDNMGPDFKIKLVGKNYIGGLVIGWSKATLCGRGSLVAKPTGVYWMSGSGIAIAGEANNTRLTINKSCKVTSYNVWDKKGDTSGNSGPIIVGTTSGKKSVKKMLVVKGKKVNLTKLDGLAWYVKGKVFKNR